MSKSIGFIGCGNMGGAILGGIADKGIFGEMYVYDKNTDKAREMADKYDAEAVSVELAAGCDVVLLAVKPNVLYSVIDEIKPFVKENAAVISIAAGQSMAKIEAAFGREIKLARVMPNTPALVGEGMSAISVNGALFDDAPMTATVIGIFGAVGKAELVPESLMDAVTGVSGSSPAYAFMFIEALADAAVEHGISKEKSFTFAAQSVLGAAKMVLETGIHPKQLKENVCSPGGTTIEAVKVLEEMGMQDIIKKAVDACVKKSRSM